MPIRSGVRSDIWALESSTILIGLSGWVRFDHDLRHRTEMGVLRIQYFLVGTPNQCPRFDHRDLFECRIQPLDSYRLHSSDYPPFDQHQCCPTTRRIRNATANRVNRLGAFRLVRVRHVSRTRLSIRSSRSQSRSINATWVSCCQPTGGVAFCVGL